MGLLGRLAALAGGGGAVRRWLGRPCAGSRPPARAAASSPALGQYGEVFRASVAEPEKVWGAAAELIQWSKPWARALERRGPGSDSW